MAKKKKSNDRSLIAENRRARHEYDMLEFIEAGIQLFGWEVRAIRAGRCQLTDSYVIVRQGEAWLLGAHINPLDSTAAHITTEPERSRKLLLHRKEIDKLIGAIDRKGNTVVGLKLYWKKQCVKVYIAVAKGRQTHDKRRAIKEREWDRQKQNIRQIR